MLQFEMIDCEREEGENNYLLEALHSFADASTHFRQFLGPKNQCCHAGNNDKFWHAQSEKSVASEASVSSSPTINAHYTNPSTS